MSLAGWLEMADSRAMEPAVALPGVEAFGLRKRWGATQAVDGVDLVVAPGEVVALLGPNGAGKSTTIDLLLGLSPPDAGTVPLTRLVADSAQIRSGP
jgi:ABC-type multidrug transport system ATPase subunit